MYGHHRRMHHCRRRRSAAALADCALCHHPCCRANGTCGHAGHHRRADADAGTVVIRMVVDEATATIVGMAIDEAADMIVVVVAPVRVRVHMQVARRRVSFSRSSSSTLVGVEVNVSAVVVMVIVMVAQARLRYGCCGPGPGPGASCRCGWRLGVLVDASCGRCGGGHRRSRGGCPRVVAVIVCVDESEGCRSAPLLKVNECCKCDRGVYFHAVEGILCGIEFRASEEVDDEPGI